MLTGVISTMMGIITFFSEAPPLYAGISFFSGLWVMVMCLLAEGLMKMFNNVEILKKNSHELLYIIRKKKNEKMDKK